VILTMLSSAQDKRHINLHNRFVRGKVTNSRFQVSTPLKIPNQMPTSGCVQHGKSSKMESSLPLHSSLKFQLCEHNYGIPILGDVKGRFHNVETTFWV
jgi:hypothetical protein